MARHLSTSLEPNHNSLKGRQPSHYIQIKKSMLPITLCPWKHSRRVISEVVKPARFPMLIVRFVRSYHTGNSMQAVLPIWILLAVKKLLQYGRRSRRMFDQWKSPLPLVRGHTIAVTRLFTVLRFTNCCAIPSRQLIAKNVSPLRGISNRQAVTLMLTGR